jgi:glycosyltransferase involved in cell wall biosynthesis
MGRPFAWREALVARHLRHTLERLQVQVLNSHMIKSDYVAAEAAATARPAVPLVITMHGCYEEFLHKPEEPEVTIKSRQALRQAAGVVYLADKNLEIFSIPGVRPLADLPHAQIYNGFEGHFSAQPPTRAQLGIEEESLVFGMVARGIAQKGWQYALDAFAELSAELPQAHLILVGSSAYLDQLRAATTTPHVHFVGFSPNPIDWVQLFNIGLLPSYFASESLPNCVAECLFCGVPMIATRIGEIPRMLQVPGQGLAGMLLEQNGRGLTDPAALLAAMRTYATSPALLAQHRKLARQAFQKFDMTACVDAYLALFQASQPAAVAST